MYKETMLTTIMCHYFTDGYMKNGNELTKKNNNKDD